MAKKTEVIKVTAPSISAKVIKAQPISGRTQGSTTQPISGRAQGSTTQFSVQIEGAFSRAGVYGQWSELVGVTEVINLDFERPLFEVASAAEALQFDYGMNPVEVVNLIPVVDEDSFLRVGSPGASQLVRIGSDGVAPRILIPIGKTITPETVSFIIGRQMAGDIVDPVETVRKDFSKNAGRDNVYLSDPIWLGVGKNLSDSSSAVDTQVFAVGKAIKDVPTTSETVTLQTQWSRSFNEVVQTTDALSAENLNSYTVENATALTSDLTYIGVDKGVLDTVWKDEKISLGIGKDARDPVSTSEMLAMSVGRVLSGYGFLRVGSPGASQLVRVRVDGVAPRILISTGSSDLVGNLETFNKSVNKGVSADIAVTSELKAAVLQDYVTGDYFREHYTGTQYTI